MAAQNHQIKLSLSICKVNIGLGLSKIKSGILLNYLHFTINFLSILDSFKMANSIHLFIYISVYPSIYLFIYLG